MSMWWDGMWWDGKMLTPLSTVCYHAKLSQMYYNFAHFYEQ